MHVRSSILPRIAFALVGLVLLSGCCGRCAPPPGVARADGSFGRVGMREGQPAEPGLPPLPEAKPPPFGPPQILLEETCLLVADPAVLEGVKRSSDGLRSVPLTRAQATALMRRLRASDRADVLQAPRLLALDGEEARIEIGETLDAGAGHPGGTTPNPRAFVGHHLDVTPILRPVAGEIELTLYSFWRARPKADGPPPAPHEIRASFTLPEDRSVLLLAPAPAAGPRYAVLLHARTLEPETGSR